jgi:hypothetical protein
LFGLLCAEVVIHPEPGVFRRKDNRPPIARVDQVGFIW